VTKWHDQADKYFLFNRPINHQAIFAKRSLFLGKVGFFDTSFVVKADHDWIMRAWMSGVSHCYLKCTIVNYELHGFSYQQRGRSRAMEKKRIQKAYFNPFGRLVIRLANRIGYQPRGVARALLNKML
jgi:hypothetical protein